MAKDTKPAAKDTTTTKETATTTAAAEKPKRELKKPVEGGRFVAHIFTHDAESKRGFAKAQKGGRSMLGSDPVAALESLVSKLKTQGDKTAKIARIVIARESEGGDDTLEL